jgi:hypothetical protein
MASVKRIKTKKMRFMVEMRFNLWAKLNGAIGLAFKNYVV